MTKADVLYILCAFMAMRGSVLLVSKLRKQQEDGIKGTLLFTTTVCLILLVSATILNFLNR